MGVCTNLVEATTVFLILALGKCKFQVLLLGMISMIGNGSKSLLLLILVINIFLYFE